MSWADWLGLVGAVLLGFGFVSAWTKTNKDDRAYRRMLKVFADFLDAMLGRKR
jgi:hypothetical protein